MRTRNMPRRCGASRTWANIERDAIMFGFTADQVAVWEAIRSSVSPWSWTDDCEALASRDPGQVRA